MTLLEIYDQLAAAKDDPAEFKQLRDELIDKFLEDYPEDKKNKFKQLLWNEEKILHKYKDPVARYNVAVERMWDKSFELGRLWKALAGDMAE